MQSQASNGLQRWPEPGHHVSFVQKLNWMAYRLLFSIMSHHSCSERITYCEVVCRQLSTTESTYSGDSQAFSLSVVHPSRHFVDIFPGLSASWKSVGWFYTSADGFPLMECRALNRLSASTIYIILIFLGSNRFFIFIPRSSISRKLNISCLFLSGLEALCICCSLKTLKNWLILYFYPVKMSCVDSFLSHRLSHFVAWINTHSDPVKRWDLLSGCPIAL